MQFSIEAMLLAILASPGIGMQDVPYDMAYVAFEGVGFDAVLVVTIDEYKLSKGLTPAQRLGSLPREYVSARGSDVELTVGERYYFVPICKGRWLRTGPPVLIRRRTRETISILLQCP